MTTSMDKECRLCKIGEGKQGEYGLVDCPFWSGKDYFSIVSIGAFIDGWTMLVTKRHVYNMHSEYAKSVFKQYLSEHIAVIRKKYEAVNKIIFFEHGANKCDSAIACGTSHAHLHILPFNDSILNEIQSDKNWIKCDFAQIGEIVGDKEYLLYGEMNAVQMETKLYVHIVEIPESQYFRRILAEKIALASNYSYKAEIRIEESIKIRKKFEG